MRDDLRCGRLDVLIAGMLVRSTGRVASVAILAAAACGEVPSPRPAADAGGTGDTLAQPGLVTYEATLDATQPVAFGGPSPDGNFCNYTITLKQLLIDLSILPTKQILSGQLRVQQVEATEPTCPNGVIPANVATYTLSSAVPSGANTMLTFQPGASNEPKCSLVGTLTPAGSGFTAQLTFHRSDISTAALAWTVTTPTLTLSAP
jgi:hypothetical protein